jgi:hypothetical protein
MMAIYNLYSKRKKAERGELPDVYQYDDFKKSLRVKIVHILKDIVESLRNIYETNKLRKEIVNILCREEGALYLNHYLPNYLENQNNALKCVLESGMPILPNNLGGHGQGDTIATVELNYAEFALNITASNIIFLASLLDTNEKEVIYAV